MVKLSVFHSVHYGAIITLQTIKHTLRCNCNNVLIYINCYMFRPSQVLQPRLHSCVQQTHLLIISIMCFGAVDMTLLCTAVDMTIRSDIVVHSCGYDNTV
jgi:hypothetical protein